MLTIDNNTVELKIYDMPGMDQYLPMVKSYLTKAMGVVWCFSICDKYSFDKLEEMLNNYISHANPDVPVIMVGTKADLNERREVSFEEAQKFAQNHGLEYIETSAKDDVNIKEIFERLTKKIIDGPNLKSKTNVISSRTAVFQLSIDAFKQINFDNYENDFEFIFRNNKSLMLPSFLAEFLSPDVSHLRLNDPTFYRYEERRTKMLPFRFERNLGIHYIALYGA